MCGPVRDVLIVLVVRHVGVMVGRTTGMVSVDGGVVIVKEIRPGG